MFSSLSLRWCLLLYLVKRASAQALILTVPEYPESNVTMNFKWTGGVPPYTAYVLTPDLEMYYYKYVGSDLMTSWDFTLNAGTEIVFQCRDSADDTVNSPIFTVISTLTLQQYPHQPESGATYTIEWGGGLAPYTVSILSPELQTQYWTYQGSLTSASLAINLTPGTQFVIQVVDGNDITYTTGTITVQAPPSPSTTSQQVPGTSQTTTTTPATTPASSTTSQQVPGTTQTTTTPPASSTTVASQNTPQISPTLTTTVPNPSPSVNTEGIFGLLKCSECGGQSCVFNDVEPMEDAVYALIIGSPVDNCYDSSDLPPVTDACGGSITVGDAWSTEVSVGVDLGDLKIGSTTSWSRSTSQTYTQTITIVVPGGYMGVLVANVQYKQSNGTITFPTGDPLFVISNQPSELLYYEPIIVPCNSQFPANISANSTCTSFGQLRTSPPASLSLAVTAVMGVTLGFLFT